MRRSDRGVLCWTLSAALLPMVLGFGVAGAQAPACARPLKPYVTSGEDWFVGPQSAVQLASGLVLFGSPRVLVHRDRVAGTAKVDSGFAGVRLSSSDAATMIAPPRDELRLAEVRAIKTGRDEARVIFWSAPASAEEELENAAVELWTGLVGAEGWKAVRMIGTYAVPLRLKRELSGDPVEHGGDVVFGFSQPLGAPDADGVVLVRIGGEAIDVRSHQLSVSVISYVSLASYEGTLWMAMTANAAGDEGFLGIWVAKFDGKRWSSPIRLVAGGEVQVHQPRLLPTADGLVVAWFEGHPQEPQQLRWMSATASPGSALVQSLVGVRWPMSRGTGAFEHLLAVTIDDSTAKVLELSPTGHREVATIPSIAFAPVIAGDAGRPVVISVIANEAKPGNATIGYFDLRCGLPAARARR